jgi:RNA polymerase sigma-70 factor (ECF subfamily)
VDPDEFIPTRASLLSRLKDLEDQTGWREFFDTYWRLIYGVARKTGLTDAEAQDVVQETLLAATQTLPGFTYDPTKDSFKGWLVRVTQWKVADQFRKREKAALTRPAGTLSHPMKEGRGQGAGADTARTATVERVADPAGFALQELWEEEWQNNLLQTALDRLKRRVPPAHYEMYYLHVVKEQPVREVARALGVSAAQVYLAKHRLGRLLKKELQQLEKEMR